MRTTLTLDADVARLIEEQVHRERKSFKEVVNDAIRRGLSPRPSRSSLKPYRLVAHDAALLPGLDPARFNQLADEMEDESIVARLGPLR